MQQSVEDRALGLARSRTRKEDSMSDEGSRDEEAYLQGLTDDQLLWLGLNTFLAQRPDVRARVEQEQARRAALRPPIAIEPARHTVILRWTHWDGTITSWRDAGPDLATAWHDVVTNAGRAGWTPPRWWQWWRRHDSRPPLDQA
jgi:hypothetical protein